MSYLNVFKVKVFRADLNIFCDTNGLGKISILSEGMWLTF